VAAAPHLEVVRALAWLALFLALTTTGREVSGAREDPGGRNAAGRPLPAAVAPPLALATVYALGLAGLAYGMPLAAVALVTVKLVASIAVVAVIAIVLRNASDAQLWQIKFLCFPLSGLFAYDLLLDAQALGFGSWIPEMADARGPLMLLALPFLLFGTVRMRRLKQSIRVSHRGALYSTALIASGVYLLGVAGAAVALRGLPESLRLPLQVAAVFTGVVLFLALITSGAVRAGLKQFVAGNFFARKYDYLHEWQRLLATLADRSVENPLEQRLICAIADVVEAPGGALYVYDGVSPRIAGGWNFRPTETPRLAPGDFDQPRRAGEAGAPGPLTTPAADIWLAVPLVRARDIIGFVALPRSRTNRRLEAEDEALLMMAAQHCAAHLAEQRLIQSRAETQQFERFSRHYAFVVHDIKNVVSQLALLLKNFERHGHNPEFRADMTETVAHAVARLDALTRRIQGLKAGVEQEDRDWASFADMLAAETDRARLDGRAEIRLEVAPAARQARAALPWDRFSAVVGHLIANARDVSAPQQTVTVELDVSDGAVVIDVIDQGPGMSPAFVENQLFQPFRSTKPDGLGVGAYQCRAFAREFGGELEVVSAPGAGTTMRLSLPLPADTRAPAAALEGVA
jgi:signal transduction histidine kinase